MANKITKLMLNWEEYLIREYQAWWQPWANTIAYYPLNWDALDYSWNWYDGIRWNWAYYSIWVDGNQCGDFSRARATWITSSCQAEPKTVSFFLKRADLNATAKDRRQIIWMTTDFEWSWCIRCVPTQYNSITKQGTWLVWNSWWNNNRNDATTIDLNWHHICVTCDTTQTKFYFDGNLLKTYNWVLTPNSILKIGQTPWIGNNPLNWYLQYIILESVEWTAQDIQDYLSNFSY